MPLHAVSSGQVLLAFSPPTFVQRYLGRPMERFTDRTLVTADALLERMRAIRRDGYTWALEEFDEGITSVAAPVADASGEVVAAVHLHGPSYRFPSAGAEADAGRGGRGHRGADLRQPAPGGLTERGRRTGMPGWGVMPAIRVDDMAAALAFYVDRLGFTLERGGPTDDNSVDRRVATPG